MQNTKEKIIQLHLLFSHYPAAVSLLQSENVQTIETLQLVLIWVVSMKLIFNIWTD